MLRKPQPDRKAATPLVESFMSFGSHLNPQWASYFPNVTGFAHGEIDFFNITSPSLAAASFPWKPHADAFMGDTNMTELVTHFGSWNWTGSDKVSWSIVDRAPVIIKGVTEKIAMVHVGWLHYFISRNLKCGTGKNRRSSFYQLRRHEAGF
jgi:hypothetical protein